MERTPPFDNPLVISYLTLRKVIGLLGLLLPFLVTLGAWLLFQTGPRVSLSAYYHTGMRDVLVGILFAIGFFLGSYKGYERKDNLAGNLAGVFAVGLALFPTAQAGASCGGTCRISNYLHDGFAALLFLTLAYFSLGLFTKTDRTRKATPQKLQRNVVYRACGVTILACIALIPGRLLLPAGLFAAVEEHSPILWLEALAVLAFGVSWLTKGEAILQDELGPPS
jgi:hypothetical protein